MNADKLITVKCIDGVTQFSREQLEIFPYFANAPDNTEITLDITKRRAQSILRCDNRYLVECIEEIDILDKIGASQTSEIIILNKSGAVVYKLQEIITNNILREIISKIIINNIEPPGIYENIYKTVSTILSAYNSLSFIEIDKYWSSDCFTLCIKNDIITPAAAIFTILRNKYLHKDDINEIINHNSYRNTLIKCFTYPSLGVLYNLTRNHKCINNYLLFNDSVDDFTHIDYQIIFNALLYNSICGANDMLLSLNESKAKLLQNAYNDFINKK